MSEFSGAARRFVRVNATADGNQTVVAAVPGQRITVLGYSLSFSAVAGSVTLQDTAGSPAIFASFQTGTTNVGDFTYAGNDDCPAFQLAQGVGLVVNNSAGVDCTGHITYTLS